MMEIFLLEVMFCSELVMNQKVGGQNGETGENGWFVVPYLLSDFKIIERLSKLIILVVTVHAANLPVRAS